MQIKYGDTATSEGVLFATYSALIGESQAGGQLRTRLKQILDWCEPGFDGVVSFTFHVHKIDFIGRGLLTLCHNNTLKYYIYYNSGNSKMKKLKMKYKSGKYL